MFGSQRSIFPDLFPGYCAFGLFPPPIHAKARETLMSLLINPSSQILINVQAWSTVIQYVMGILDLGRLLYGLPSLCTVLTASDLGQCSPTRLSRFAAAEVNIYFRLREHFYCGEVYDILFPNIEETSSKMLSMKVIRFLGIGNVNYLRFSENVCHLDIRVFFFTLSF